MLFSEIQIKDVINLTDGNKIGRVKDIDIDTSNGNIISINVMTNSRFRSFFSGEEIIIIPWQKVMKFGQKVIIVNHKDE